MQGAESWNTGTTWSANHRSWSGNGTHWDPLTQYRALTEQHPLNANLPLFEKNGRLVFKGEVFFQNKADVKKSNGIKKKKLKEKVY